jgi:toxin ParE1/3/4
VKVVWTDYSEQTVADIIGPIASDNPSAATRLFNKFRERVKYLETFPGSGRKVPEYDIDSIKELIEGNYRIVYRYLGKDLVEVLIVWESHRLLPSSPADLA